MAIVTARTGAPGICPVDAIATAMTSSGRSRRRTNSQPQPAFSPAGRMNQKTTAMETPHRFKWLGNRSNGIYDLVRSRRIYPISLWLGVGLFVIDNLCATVVGPSAAWHAFAGCLIA